MSAITLYTLVRGGPARFIATLVEPEDRRPWASTAPHSCGCPAVAVGPLPHVEESDGTNWCARISPGGGR